MCLAVPGKILTLFEQENLGLRPARSILGVSIKEVCLDYTPVARLEDYVLVHVGFALTVVDEEEAQRVFEALKQLNRLEEPKESAT